MVRRSPKTNATGGSHGAPASSPHISSVSSVSNEDEKKELDGLKQSIFVPLIDQMSSQNLPTVSIKKQDTPVNASFTAHPEASLSVSNESKSDKQKASTRNEKRVRFPKDMDLIQFSDTEVFEVDNLGIYLSSPPVVSQYTDTFQNNLQLLAGISQP